MVIIATLWNGIVNVIKFADPTKNFMDKIVIDVTNPSDFSKDMLPKLASYKAYITMLDQKKTK